MPARGRFDDHRPLAISCRRLVPAPSYLEIPLSPALVALIATLPGIVLFGWAVARRPFRERLPARIATVGIAFGAWVLATHVFGLVTRTLTGGLAISSVGLGSAGVVMAWRDRRRPPPPTGHTRRDLVDLLMLSTALTVPIAMVAWRWAFHDEIGLGGHQAMIAAIQNDHYPPRSLAFPQFELAYHYGFDLLCAMLTALFRVRVTTAIDLATTGLWFYTVLAVWMLGERLIDRRAGPLAALVVLFGGGMPFTCSDSMGQALAFSTHFLAFCEEGGVLLNPSLSSYFFQHPWTLGLPLALTILLVESEDDPQSRKLQLGALVGLLAALAITQVTAFLTLLGAVTASRLFVRDGRRLGFRIASAAVLVGAGVADVAFLGGFFASKGSNAQQLAFHLGVANTQSASLWWMLKSFGLLLLGFVGLFWLPKRRLLLATLALGGTLVVNTVRYRLSWDIVKFATVAGLALAFAWTALLRRLRTTPSRLVGTWLPSCLIGLTIFSGLAFTGTLALALPGIPWMYAAPQPEMNEDARRAANLLRHRMPADAVMYRRYEESISYASYSGLPQVWINPGLATDRAFEPGRSALAAALPDAPAPYLAERVRFFVLDAADTRLNVVADAWLARGQARLLARFGDLRVVELLTAAPPLRAQGGNETYGVDSRGSG
jgi:hypothetical protein